jgi:hypothetical protein
MTAIQGEMEWWANTETKTEDEDREPRDQNNESSREIKLMSNIQSARFEGDKDPTDWFQGRTNMRAC